ncbi:hypothetical protein ACFUIZ_06690 [Streptomyces cinereoruber]|uniref:hypothetical protein n=1 Tax=Streptomyces cinereoruber TaxID=67260 RepID=UPI00364412F3
MGSQDQHRPSKAERLAARAAKIQREAAGITDPEASEDALREAARLRVAAREVAAAERREQNARDAVDIDKLRAERRARMAPGGTPLGGAA